MHRYLKCQHNSYRNNIIQNINNHSCYHNKSKYKLLKIKNKLNILKLRLLKLRIRKLLKSNNYQMIKMKANSKELYL
jgi:hypothetical protein